MALCSPTGREVVSTGTIEGKIMKNPRGENGFGYDPIFFVPQLDHTLAEISLGQKNQISHRARALEQMSFQMARFLPSGQQG